MINEELERELRSAIESGSPLRVFYSGQQTGFYGLGFVPWMDSHWIMLADLELNGQPDGHTLVRIDSIESVSINDTESKRAKALYENHFGRGSRRSLQLPTSLRFGLHQFLKRRAKLNKSIAVLPRNGEWEYGILLDSTKSSLKILRLDYMGVPDGEQLFLIDAIEHMGFDRRNDVARWRMFKMGR